MGNTVHELYLGPENPDPRLSHQIVVPRTATSLLVLGQTERTLPGLGVPQTCDSRVVDSVVREGHRLPPLHGPDLVWLDFALGWVRHGPEYRNRMGERLRADQVPARFRVAPNPAIIYRGLQLGAGALAALLAGDPVTIENTRRVMSWTTDVGRARQYATKNGALSGPGCVVLVSRLKPGFLVFNITQTLRLLLGRDFAQLPGIGIEDHAEFLVADYGTRDVSILEL